MIRCASPDCSRAGPRSRSTIAADIRAARTYSGRSTAPRAICSSPPPAASPRSSRWTYAAARAQSPRSRTCPCQSSIGGRRRNAWALPPTSPKRTRVSPATIARGRICAPPSKTRSRAIACWTRSRRLRRPVIVKRSADRRRGARPVANRCRAPTRRVRRVGALLSFSNAGSKLSRRRHPIQEWAHPPLGDPHDELKEALLRCGVLKRTCVDRLVARFSVELLDNLPRLLVAAPQIARPRARLANPVVDRGEVGVERLRRRSVGPRLHVFGVGGEALWGLHAHEVCRVDNRFALESLHGV